MKNFSLYSCSLCYNTHLLDNVKLSQSIQVRNCYSAFLSSCRHSYFLKLIAKQKKKGLFFDKFLLKYLIAGTVNKQRSYLQNSTLNKLYRTFIVSGKKIKAYSTIMSSFFKVYSVINLEIYKEVSKSYLYFKEFLFNKELNKEFNSVSSIVNWLFFWYQPIFCVKCSLVPKKYRKKLKKKYVYSVNYIDPTRRKNISLRWMLHFMDNFSSYKLNNRLFLLFSDLIFNFKKSVMYERKVIMYRKMFKI